MSYVTDNFHGYPLRAIEAFWNLTPERIKEIAKGCGPGFGWKETIIPDTILGVCITPACIIHDVEYHFAGNESERDAADLNFIHNALTINEVDSRFWLAKIIRRRIIFRYYEACSDFGKAAFWASKRKEKQ